MAAGQGLVVLRKVLSDRGNAFLAQIVEAFSFILADLPISPIGVELGRLRRPSDPTSIYNRLQLGHETFSVCLENGTNAISVHMRVCL